MLAIFSDIRLAHISVAVKFIPVFSFLFKPRQPSWKLPVNSLLVHYSDSRRSTFGILKSANKSCQQKVHYFSTDVESGEFI